MKINMSKSGLELSRIVQGMMRLNEWGFSKKELENFILKAIDFGVTTFDHADIYGNYTCEKIFGEALKSNSSLRNKIQIITKCGIMVKNEKYQRRVKHYNTSKIHIIESVENSLKNLNTDHIDLLLIHRPDPFMNPEEISEAFDELYNSGKVLYFGVSNFTIQQFKTLQSWVNVPLITNQIEISPYNIEHFENDNIYFLMEKRINPMAWSPLAGGNLFKINSEKASKIFYALKEIGKDFSIDSLDTIAYAWLLSHPAGIIPISGSGKIERLENAVKSLELKLSPEQWYIIYEAALGHRVP
ncbi:oxidoreductase [Marinitoga sp. 1197]|uniref:aldo/keto reductase n=1 Tax=Marinitoga sp. 1197 TaxID=1428449 RepID=UPI00064158CF|nr:aldo/keto reductase [Marinitoga sp. 1197]KLO20975.1 oxidoreductase [Marinitoga sp. 1197]